MDKNRLGRDPIGAVSLDSHRVEAVEITRGCLSEGPHTMKISVHLREGEIKHDNPSIKMTLFGFGEAPIPVYVDGKKVEVE